MISIAFKQCVIKCSVALIFCSFLIIRILVNTDVLEQSPEVFVNAVVL